MIRFFWAALIAIVIPIGSAQAQSFHVPGAGSSERRAILDALRPAVEAKVGPHVEFVVDVIRSGERWAFVVAQPQRKGGRPINGRAYFPIDWDNMDGLRVDAVLQFRNNRWNLIDHAIGATDVWYCGVGPRILKRGYGC